MNSLRRLWAITQKELRQLARDRLTFGMVVMIPLIQLLLFATPSTPTYARSRWDW